LRDDATTVEKLAKNKQKPLSLEMGEKLARELRAVKYVECSALTQVTVSSIFRCEWVLFIEILVLESGGPLKKKEED
jgi:hypothetical protein